MQVHTGADARPASFEKPVATLGVFDGVHRGHRAVLGKVRSWADETGGDAVVITFDPHPLQVLQGRPPPLLTPLRFRLRLFEQLGLDHAVVLRFTPALSAMPARDFLERILLGGIGTRRLVLGPDAFFGKDREGNAGFLESVRDEYALEAVSVPFLTEAGAKVSSTEVRRAIAAGALDTARALLGRPYTLFGQVVRGDGRGRVLGFPTANLATAQVLPPHGVYHARTRIGERSFRALTNIGVAPTVVAGRRAVPEVHLLDFEGDLYGTSIEVELLAKLRPEMHFPDRNALVDQIGRDVEQARQRAGSV